MKKSLTQFVLMLLALLFPAVATAYDFEADGIYYSYNSGASGSQVMVARGEVPYSGDIVIPAEVTHGDMTYRVTVLGDSAFYGCTAMTSISLPNTLTSLGFVTFFGCTGLTSVDIPEGISSVNGNVF